MSRTATAQSPKVRRRRPVMLALWGHALVDSARKRALQLHQGRARLDWERGFVELKVTVRGAGCAECGRKIQPGTLALHAFSGDTGRTPHERYIHLSRCTAACSDCQFYPCRCRRMLKVAAPDPVRPEQLAARGLERPGTLTWDEIQAVCELALQGRREGAA